MCFCFCFLWTLCFFMCCLLILYLIVLIVFDLLMCIWFLPFSNCDFFVLSLICFASFLFFDLSIWFLPVACLRFHLFWIHQGFWPYHNSFNNTSRTYVLFLTSTSPARSLSELKFHEAMRKKCQRLAARHRRKQLLPLTHKFSRRFSQKRVGVSSGWKKAFKEGARSEPYLRTLTRRKRSLLYRIGVKHFPEHKARAVDLSQNFNFTELAPYVPCLTPRGEKYITSRCRPLLGLESLRLQGLWVGDESDPEDFYAGMSEALLKDLAGNAFESSCFAAAFWCTLRLNACVHRLQEPIQIPRTLAPELEDGPESDSDVRTSYSDATTLRYGETRRSKKKWGHTLRSYF